MLITKGYGSASIVTSGYGGATGFFIRVREEFVRLYSNFMHFIKLKSDFDE